MSDAFRSSPDTPVPSLDKVHKEIATWSDHMMHDYMQQFGGEALRPMLLPTSTLLASAKMEALRVLLPRLERDGHRMLIFSQWTKLLDLLELLMHDMNYRFVRLDGQLPIMERQKLIDQYTNDEGILIFLLSTKAGGLGINLTAADTVILHDLDFNPHNDRQAEDRSHRMGQKRKVTIYKLVAANTVDEAIYRMQERKARLDTQLLGDSNAYDTASSTANEGEEMASMLAAEVAKAQEYMYD